MASSDTVKIDPHGDVTLVCGEEVGDKKTLKLRVSSVILTRGSQVFRALLAPHFKEGTTLATTSAVEIALPEDSPDHMSTLCNILHMRYDRIPESLDPARMTELAKLCDKYDCAVAVMPSMERYVMATSTTAQVPVLVQNLAIASVLRYESLARRIAKQLVLKVTKPINEVAGAGPIPPASTWAQVDNILLKAQREITNFFEYMVDDQLQCHLRASLCDTRCTAGRDRIASLLVQLKDYKLWSPEHPRDSLDVTLRNMESIRIHEPSGTTSCSAGRNCLKGQCGRELSSYVGEIQAKAGYIRGTIDELVGKLACAE